MLVFVASSGIFGAIFECIKITLEYRLETLLSPYRIVAEQPLGVHKIQLVEDQRGGYYFRKVLADTGEIVMAVPIHNDPSVFAEASEYFPEFLPFGGLPVDAS